MKTGQNIVDIHHQGFSMRYRRLYLDGYSYFITIVTHRRRPILITHIDLLRESFRHAMRRFDFDLEAVVVLPDHLHMIIRPAEARRYPAIVASIKRRFSSLLPETLKEAPQSAGRRRQRYLPVWQRRFYEHTIRDEKDREKYLDYIRHNPVKHGLVDDPGQWIHSSFHHSRP
jgi:putative transposase